MSDDPTVTDPDLYKVIFENDRVRVLEYRDVPGARTRPHRHPDSVMYTLSRIRRRVTSGGQQVDVDIAPGQVRWLAAQEHIGENVGDTETHAIFCELKEPTAAGAAQGAPLGPTT
jgi:hypothetical protein